MDDLPDDPHNKKKNKKSTKPEYRRLHEKVNYDLKKILKECNEVGHVITSELFAEHRTHEFEKTYNEYAEDNTTAYVIPWDKRCTEVNGRDRLANIFTCRWICNRCLAGRNKRIDPCLDRFNPG